MNWLKGIWLLITNIKTIIELAKKLWGLISPILQTFQGKKAEPSTDSSSADESSVAGGENQTAPSQEKPKRRGLFRRLRNRR